MSLSAVDLGIVVYCLGVVASSWMLGNVGEPHLWYKRYLREHTFQGRGTAVELALMMSSLAGIVVQVMTMYFTRPPQPPMPTHEDIP